MSAERPVLQALPSEEIDELLERIRNHAGARFAVDCSAHPELRQDGLLRRLVIRAASTLGKDVQLQAGRTPFRARPLPPARPAGSPRPVHGLPPVRSLETVLPRRIFGGWAMFGFAFLTGAMLTGVVLFLLPRAEVVVRVTSEPLVLDLSPSLDATVTAGDTATGVHPARLRRVSEVRRVTVPVSSSEERGERASGTVDMVNRTSTIQGIRQGTRLQNAAGVVLRTLRDVLVPPQGRAGVPVRADQGGERGNVEPQRLFLPALSSAAQPLLWAEVVTPLSGGTDRSVRVVTTMELEQATTQLREQGESALRAQPEEGPPVFRLPNLKRVVLEDLQAVPAVGTEAETLRVEARVRAEALVADQASLEAFLERLVAAQAGAGKSVAERVTADTLRVVDVRWEQGRALLSLHVETSVRPAVDPETLRAQLSGRTPAEATAFLRALPGVREARVQLTPAWVRRVPTVRRNVRVLVEPEGRTPAGSE